VRPELNGICISVCLVLLPARMSFPQFPQSVICQFEGVATPGLDSSGKVVTNSEHAPSTARRLRALDGQPAAHLAGVRQQSEGTNEEI
jgi:hypothetical protein